MRVEVYAFESAPAAPSGPIDAYLHEVEDADIYLGIFWRQFSRPTYDEYHLAQKLGKPSFIFVKRFEPQPRDAELEQLLGEISKAQKYDQFDNVVDLASKIVDALSSWIADRVISGQVHQRVTSPNGGEGIASQDALAGSLVDALDGGLRLPLPASGQTPDGDEHRFPARSFEYVANSTRYFVAELARATGISLVDLTVTVWGTSTEPAHRLAAVDLAKRGSHSPLRKGQGPAGVSWSEGRELLASLRSLRGSNQAAFNALPTRERLDLSWNEVRSGPETVWAIPLRDDAERPVAVLVVESNSRDAYARLRQESVSATFRGLIHVIQEQVLGLIGELG